MGPLQRTHPLNHQDPQSHLLQPLGSSWTPSPWHSLQASFVSRPGWMFLTVNSQMRENSSDGCSWITVKSCQGQIWQSRFFPWHTLFLSSVSYLCHLSTFLHFPWVSFSVKWRDWISCLQTVLPGAFWRLGWAPVEGGRRQWAMLSSKRRKGLQLKTSGEPGAQALRIMRLHPLWLDSASVIGSASQSPLASPNVTLEVFLSSIHQSAPVCQALC